MIQRRIARRVNALSIEALQERATRAYLQACELDVLALKPGNVGVHAPGHRMVVEDFQASAQASASTLCAIGATVGGRIEGAVSATKSAVGTNTNLGIVLLCAPIIHAHLSAQPHQTQPLREQIRATLVSLSVDDAHRAFAAIRIANPAGLGRSDQHDVHAPVTGTLLDAMRIAAPRDTIATQYVSAYADIWEVGLPVLDRALHANWSWPWAAAAVFLSFLARYPDSHVQRKLGGPEAKRLQAEAARFLGPQGWRDDLPEAQAELLAWDSDLKTQGVNPGTAADLTVATLLVGLLR